MLSKCLHILEEIYWNYNYQYIDLKGKINRKIRLLLSEYYLHTSFGRSNDYEDGEQPWNKYQEVIDFATAANGGRNINTQTVPVNPAADE